jgi:hypothetical protein
LGQKNGDIFPDSKGGSKLPAFKHYPATSPDRPDQKNHLSAPNLFAHPHRIGPQRSLVAVFNAPHDPNPGESVGTQGILSIWVPIIHAITRQPRIVIKSERKGKKIWGKKMETFSRIRRADQNSPLSNTIPPLHQIAPIKKIIFLPQIFLPTLTALERDDPSSPFSTPPPRPESVPIFESEANLCPSVLQSFMPSPVNPVSSSSQNGRAKRFGAKKWRHSPGLKGLIKTPRVQALSRHFTRSPRSKKSSFCPKSFYPPALPGPRRSLVAAFQRPPRPESVPICESTANLWPSVFQSFTPSPVNACIGVR